MEQATKVSKRKSDVASEEKLDQNEADGKKAKTESKKPDLDAQGISIFTDACDFGTKLSAIMGHFYKQTR
jgi:hypothetical protein